MVRRGAARADGAAGGGQDHQQAQDEEQEHDFEGNEAASQVSREIKILKFVSHPNIIKLYEVLDTTSDIFVVMEMARGGELYEYIQKNELNEQEVRQFFRQIVEGVEHAHLNLVAHRDLKPENVLLDGNGVVKVADFGLSNLMKDGRLLRTNCGSLNYAAPEIIGRRPYEGTALDVWSCGVILFTMVVGALPFDEDIVSILYKKIESNCPHTQLPSTRFLTS
jgi:5'-AMP-activated protein kinase, catalytic alpha subunit